MNRMQEQVHEFHKIYDVRVQHQPGIPPVGRVILRVALIDEEFTEFKAACLTGDIVEAADALGDLLYVIFGAAIEFGLDMEPIVDEIHRSNLTKLGADGKPIRAANGKVLKGPDFERPDIKKILAQQ